MERGPWTREQSLNNSGHGIQVQPNLLEEPYQSHRSNPNPRNKPTISVVTEAVGKGYHAKACDLSDTDEPHRNFNRDNTNKEGVYASVQSLIQSERTKRIKRVNSQRLDPSLLQSSKKQTDEESNSSLSKLINRLDTEGKKVLDQLILLLTNIMESSQLVFANREDSVKKLKDGVVLDGSVATMVDQILDLVSSKPE